MPKVTSRREFLGAFGAVALFGSTGLASTSNGSRKADEQRRQITRDSGTVDGDADSASDSLEIEGPIYENSRNRYSSASQSTPTPTDTPTPSPTPTRTPTATPGPPEDEPRSGGGWGLPIVFGIVGLVAYGMTSVMITGVIAFRKFRQFRRNDDGTATEEVPDHEGDVEGGESNDSSEGIGEISGSGPHPEEAVQSAAEIVNDDVPSYKQDAAETAIEEAREKLQNDEYAAAKELAEKAEHLARPPIDFLLTNAREAADEAKEARETAEYDRSIEAWNRALEEYGHALDRARAFEEDALVDDIGETIDSIEDNIETTRAEQDHAEMAATVENANEMVEQGNQRFQDSDYEQAKAAFEKAEKGYENALETARQYDFDEADTFEKRLGEIEQSLQDCELALLETRIAEVEYILDHGNDYEQAEAEFEDLREELHSLPFDRPEDVNSLLERTERGHVRAQLEQRQSLIDEAKEQFEAEEFYEARESFGEAQEHLEEVLELATEYELEDLQNEIDDMIEVCIQNASEARRVLFDVGDVEEPEFTPIDELEGTNTDFSTSAGSEPDEGELREPALRDDRDIDDELKAEMPAHQKLERLGSGGHALVYKVRLEETDDVVARKTPKLGGTLTLQDAERFLDAAETWSSADDHENIVTVHDWGFDGKPWLLMEYVDGGDLSEFVGDLSIERTLEILASIADALTHARGVDHLDVKPANILLSEDGTPKLADWGLAKVAFGHAATDTSMGITPAYAAPEQVDRTLGDRDNLTDIYQLGVTGYELVTGQLPFDPDAPESLDQRILEGQPTPPSEVNPDVDHELEDVLLKAMATERTERFEAAIQLRNTLQEWLDDWREEST